MFHDRTLKLRPARPRVDAFRTPHPADRRAAHRVAGMADPKPRDGLRLVLERIQGSAREQVRVSRNTL